MPFTGQDGIFQLTEKLVKESTVLMKFRARRLEEMTAKLSVFRNIIL